MKCWVSTAVFISGSIDLVSLRRSAGESGRAVAVGDYMEAALFLIGLLPPPAAGADVFTGLYRAGAGLAANGGIATIMECVVRHSVATEVMPDIIFRPIGERIEFLHAVRGVVFLDS